MKGWELLKEIAEGKIKEETKLKFKSCYNSSYDLSEIIYRNKELLWKDSILISETVTTFELSNSDFEIIEEPEEDEIDIEETNWQEVGEILGKMYLELSKGFEKAVKQLNKKLEDI